MKSSKSRLSNEVLSYSSYILVQTVDPSTAETFAMAVPTENEKTFNYSVSTLILPAKTPILLTVGYFMQNLITTNEATELFTRKHIKLDSARLKSKIKFYLYYNEKITTSNENNQENYIELEPCYMLLPKELAESYGEIFKPTPKAQAEKKIENTITEGIDPNWKEYFYKFFSLLVLQPTKTNFLAGKLKEEQILNISEKPFAGQSIFTISSPFALLSPILYKNTVNVSYVSRVTQSKSRRLFGGSKGSYLFFINNTAKDGEEGAPVFNEYSEVIGILLGKMLPESPDSNGYSVCLSTSSIVELLSMLSFQHSSNDVWKLTASRFKPFIQSLSLKSLLPRIVKVLTGSALGSGILLNTAGFVLTNKHVLMSNKNRKIVIEVNFNNNQNDYEYYDAEIFQEAEGNIDIALLKISKKLSERAIKVIKATERFLDHPIDVRYLHGKEVYALGYTFNEFKTVDFRAIVTRGNLSKIIVYRNTPFLLATNCQTFNGFSGGAIVSDRGEFLGLITYNFTQKKKGALNTLNYSYSCNIFKEMINMIDLRDEENLKTLDIWKNQDGYVDKMIQSQNLELVPRFDFKSKL